MQFSIITVTYNAFAYLEETLTSVAMQDFDDFEHIIWDGGSRDKTLEIAHSFPHATVYEGIDKGIADAMNQGAALARGDFLLFLHADDLLAHSRVLRLVATCLRQHSTVEWLYGQAQIIDSKGEVMRSTPYEPYSFKRLRRYNFITHPATFVKRKLFEKIGGFQTHLRYCMDYDLWLRLAALTSPLPVPALFALFREHPQSLSTSEPLQVTDEVYQVRNRYVKNIYERYRSYLTWKKRRQYDSV